ncbi:MAG: hyperosmotically inducible periplasmic protein [Acidobacteriota bacterium]|nr:hyperosmotically inducible periplasmic protein [Acidobacteriota bacterium]
MKRLAAFLLGAAFVALAAACDNTANDNGNANMANSNRAVVNTNANANMNANTNANAGGNYNARITKEEYEKDKERYSREAKAKGESIGQGLEDGWLWVKTKGALATADNVTATDINVDVNNGVITLRGTQPSKAEVDAAVKVANGIDGKKSVTNQLKVAAAGNTNAGNANTHNANHK